MTYFDNVKNREVLSRDFDFFSFHIYGSTNQIVNRFDAMDKFERCNWNRSHCTSNYMLTEFSFMKGTPTWGKDSGSQSDPGAAVTKVLAHCQARTKCLSAIVWDIWRPDPTDGGFSDYCMLKGWAETPNLAPCDNKYQRMRDYLHQPGTLFAGQTLGAGAALVSADGRYRLLMQTDGNLVEYGPSGPMWWTCTYGTGAGNRFVLQTDGNAVLYRGATPLWASASNGALRHRFVVQTDGNMVVYTADNSPVWSSYGSPRPC
jgi:hypothetical protein